MKVQFDPIKHQYNDEHDRYISVTQLISLYKVKFDTDKEALKYVNNHPEFPMTVEQCLYAWDFLCDISLVKGNKYHDRKELENLWAISKLEEGYVEKLESLSNLPNNIYPELRVYNEDIKLAGHIDKITVDGIWIDVEDYKTYKEPVSKTGFRGAKMLFPLDQIPDANYYHAALQLNIYAYLLECFGYKIRSLKIHHKQFDDDEPIPEKYDNPLISEEELREPKIYDIKYNRDAVVLLINHYLENHAKSSKRAS